MNEVSRNDRRLREVQSVSRRQECGHCWCHEVKKSIEMIEGYCTVYEDLPALIRLTVTFPNLPVSAMNSPTSVDSALSPSMRTAIFRVLASLKVVSSLFLVFAKQRLSSRNDFG